MQKPQQFQLDVQRIIKPRQLPKSLQQINPQQTENPTFNPIIERVQTNKRQSEQYYLMDNQFMKQVAQFGKIYVGETIYILSQVRNVCGFDIESLKLKLNIYQEEKKVDTKTLSFAIQTPIQQNQQFFYHFDVKMEEADRYVLIFDISYPDTFATGQSRSQTQGLEKHFQKKFRIISKYPFEINYRTHSILHQHFIEYTIKNLSLVALQFHKIEF